MVKFDMMNRRTGLVFFTVLMIISYFNGMKEFGVFLTGFIILGSRDPE